MKQPGLIVDLFAGGGGASLGLEMALGRPVDVAVNHNPEAVAIHTANHPGTRHFVQNIHQVHPLDATGGRPVDILWASPDCKHFSKAKGTKPKDRNIRELAWSVVPWIRYTQPRVVFVENVEEFLTWGPLDQDGQPIKSRSGETFQRWVRAIKAEGYSLDWRLLRACDYGAPTIRRRLFIIARRDRRPINWPEPTHGPGRPPVGGLLRSDGSAITVGPPSSDFGETRQRLQPWATAADCIDWSIPAPSIFDRPKPLAENTLKRIAEGLRRYVIEAKKPFIVSPDQAAWLLQANTGVIGRAADWPMSTICQTGSHQQLVEAALSPFIQHVQHGGLGRGGVMPANEPLRTITAYPKGGGQALAVASLIHYYGAKNGQRPRCGDLVEPFRTATAAGNRFGLATAFLAKTNHTAHYYNCFRGQGFGQPLQTITQTHGFSLVSAALAPFVVGAGGPRYGGKPVVVDKPFGTMTSENHKALVAASLQTVGLQSLSIANQGFAIYLSHFNGTFQDGGIALPMKTVTAGGFHAGLAAAFLTKYYGTAWAEPVDVPFSTVTGRPKLALTSAFLTKYYSKGGLQALTEPLGTLTTVERFGLVLVHQTPLVWVEGEPYVIADIGLRMLTPRELARAQGFPDGYEFTPVFKGKPLIQKAQVAAIGNSVPPAFSYSLVRANLDALDQVETRPRRRRSKPALMPGLLATEGRQ